MKNKRFFFIESGILIISLGIVILLFLNYFNLFPKKWYSMEEWNIERIISPNDQDQDGIDDYTDIYLGALEYVRTNPQYKSAYYSGGYPKEGEGVCTDVIWYALKQAGYSLKDLVDKDIAEHTKLYPRVNGKPDPNIDFRRVLNLEVFFRRNTLSLTTDLEDIAAWQPGDIVIFKSHIGIISEKRNKKGYPYLIHHSSRPNKEEDVITRYEIVGHYRFFLKNNTI